MTDQAAYLKDAQTNDPSGATCGWCGGPNTFADDVGFFYCTPEGSDTRPTCEKCYRGDAGTKHHQRYGWGER